MIRLIRWRFSLLHAYADTARRRPPWLLCRHFSCCHASEIFFRVAYVCFGLFKSATMLTKRPLSSACVMPAFDERAARDGCCRRLSYVYTLVAAARASPWLRHAEPPRATPAFSCPRIFFAVSPIQIRPFSSPRCCFAMLVISLRSFFDFTPAAVLPAFTRISPGECIYNAMFAMPAMFCACPVTRVLFPPR